MIRVLVCGAAGKMGTEVVKAVKDAEGMEVVAEVDDVWSGATGTTIMGRRSFNNLDEAIKQTHPDVMVDFTHPSAVEGNIRTALAHTIDCVIGTTGLNEAQLAEIYQGSAVWRAEKALKLTDWEPDEKEPTLFVAPNFAVGAVLMMMFAMQAVLFMPNAEITELHHDKKADAPSGTAIRTARMIAAARTQTPQVPGKETELSGMEGARGAVIDGIHVHSVRLPGLMAHQEVLFGGQGQTLTIRHDSIDRTSFMPGVVLAVREVVKRSGLIIGLDNFLSSI